MLFFCIVENVNGVSTNISDRMPLNTFKLIVFTFLKMLRKTVPRTTEIFYGRSLSVRISVLWWIMLRSDGGLYWHGDISDHYSDTPGHPRRSRGWITGKLFEYLEWLCTQARIIFLPVSRLYLWFVICWLLLLSSSPAVLRVVLRPTFSVLASPPALPCHVSLALVQVSLSRSRDMLTHHYHHHHSLADKAHSTGLILAGIAEGSNFAGLTKKVSYERDDRAWDSQTIRTISYHLSWRPPPTLTLTHLILDHSQRSAQFIFYSSSKQAASVRIMLSA